MMLTEQSSIPASALPIAEFKAHLRLGTGFTDDGDQDGLLERLLRSAVLAIEARTSKILLMRDFLWVIEEWRDPVEQALPIAPVLAIASLVFADRGGVRTLVDPGRYALIADTHRPKLVATTSILPVVPDSHVAEVLMQAGFGASWDAVPADLAQAVFLLAAHYYEQRSEGEMQGIRGLMPAGVNALIQRYKTVRLLGGRS